MTFRSFLAQRKRANDALAQTQDLDVSYDPVLVRWRRHVEAAEEAHSDPNPFFFPDLSNGIVQRVGVTMGLSEQVADLAAIRMYVYYLLAKNPEDGWRKTRSLRRTHRISAAERRDAWEASNRLVERLIADYHAQRPDALKFVNLEPETGPTKH